MHAWREQGFYRTRRIHQAPLSFASNDYLGLAQDDRVKMAFCEGVSLYGVGATGSALLSGYSAAHRDLESAFSEYFNREASVLLSSGYLANIGLLQALVQRGDTVLQDKLNHASLLDGVRFAGAILHRYRHCQASHLADRLKQALGRKWVVTDHVFSMRGEIAPLREIIPLAQSAGAPLVVDHAHGLGVIDFPYSQAEVHLLVCPLGKAMGGAGAVISGSREDIDQIVQFARSYMFSTALPPAMAHAMRMSLKLIQTEPHRLMQLKECIALFKSMAQSCELNLCPSETAIQMWTVGSAAHAVAWGAHFLSHGIDVAVVRPPSVPPHEAGLRISLSSRHTHADLEYFFEVLEKGRCSMQTQ